MKPTDVIRRPLVTEKTTIAREGSPVVVFEVAVGATKIDVKRAVEKLFGSKVAVGPHADHARQDQAPGPVLRPALGLEEGVGPVQGRREGAGVPAKES